MKGFLVVLAISAVAFGGYYYLENRPTAGPNPMLLQELQSANIATTSTTVQASTTPAMKEYTDDFGISFWYPSSWTITTDNGMGSQNLFIQLYDSSGRDVFEITENMTEKSTPSDFMKLTAGNLPVFTITRYLPNEWGTATSTYKGYVIPLTGDVTAPPSLFVLEEGSLSSLPLITTFSSASTTLTPDSSAVLAEQSAYTGK